MSRALALVWKSIHLEARVCAGIRIFRSLRHQARPHRIHVDVLAMMFVVGIIPNAVVVRPWLPDLVWKMRFFVAAVRKPAFDELNRSFHRNLYIGRQN